MLTKRLICVYMQDGNIPVFVLIPQVTETKCLPYTPKTLTVRSWSATIKHYVLFLCTDLALNGL